MKATSPRSASRPGGGAHERVTVSLGWKLWLIVTVVVGAASLLLFYELTRRERQSLVNGKARAASMVADEVARSLSAPLDFEDNDAIAQDLELAAKTRDVLGVGVFDTGGKLTASAGDAASLDRSRPEVISTDAIAIARPVVGRSNATLGTMAIAFSLAPENALFESTRESLLRLCALLGIGTATLLVGLAQWWLVRPLARLAVDARQLEKGARRTRRDKAATRRDEIGALARAFSAMNDAVIERETELTEARRSVVELLDNMRQGIVAFDAEGVVLGKPSRAAIEIFGVAATDAKADARLVDWLFPGRESWEAERAAFDAWLEVIGLVGADEWETLAELAPREVSYVRPGARRAKTIVALEFRRLDGATPRFMLLATDVTSERLLEAARDQQTAEVVALKRTLAGARAVRMFFETASARAAVAVARAESRAGWTEAFEIAHTLRGEAAALELAEIEIAARDAESALEEARRSDEPTTLDRAKARVDALASSIAAVASRLHAIAPDLLSDRSDVAVSRASLDRALAAAGTRTDALSVAVRALEDKPFSGLIAPIREGVARWAAHDQKEIDLVVEGESVTLPKALAAALPGVLVNLVRNAIAHGIEAPADRARLGKPARGAIRVACRRAGESVEISVDDDGAGISADVSSRVFEAGFSTRAEVDDLAGRGMGLSAVRAALDAVGYRIDLQSTEGKGARFTVRA